MEDTKFIQKLKDRLRDHAWTFFKAMSENEDTEQVQYSIDALGRVLPSIEDITSLSSFIGKCQNGVFDEMGIDSTALLAEEDDPTMMLLLKATFEEVDEKDF